MPELPEVEVVRRGLATHLLGARVAGVEVLHPRAVRRQLGGAAELAGQLGGRSITATGRRGKFLWLATDEPGLVLGAHLGMSGQFRIDGPGMPTDPPAPGASVTLGDAGAGAPVVDGQLGRYRHGRVRFDLDDGRQLWFVDQRTFGWVAVDHLVEDPHGVLVPTLVRAIAPDPTEAAFDARVVARRMRQHRVEVKRLLLDQSLVSGVGNIYADEALWRAGVHPRRRADRMPLAALAGVLHAAAEVMGEALLAGGTSFDSLYVNVNGESGYFGRGLAVYGRTGLPCPRCGTPIVRERFTNRSSHLCPTCQRPPRARH